MENNIILGRHPVREALRKKCPINKLFLIKGMPKLKILAEILSLAKSQQIPIHWVDRSYFNHLTETDSHQGVALEVSFESYQTLDDLSLKLKEKQGPPLLVMLDGVEDPRNLGAILRSAEGAGVDGVIIPKRRAVGLTEAAVKTSAGASQLVPVVRVTNLSETIKKLKEWGLWIFGVDPSGDKKYNEVDFSVPSVLVMGGESKGISRLVKSHCDFLISIPLVGRIASLNVSVATAIVAYEVLRQRGVR